VQASKPIRHWRTWGEFYDFSFNNKVVTRPVVVKYDHWIWIEILFEVLYYSIPRTRIFMFKIFERTIKTSIVIIYQDMALEEYVDQDYLWMLRISVYSTPSLMSDFMSYREVSGIEFETRMIVLKEFERRSLCPSMQRTSKNLEECRLHGSFMESFCMESFLRL